MERRCTHCHSLCGPADLKCGSCGSGDIEGPPPVAPDLLPPAQGSAPRSVLDDPPPPLPVFPKVVAGLAVLPVAIAAGFAIFIFVCCGGVDWGSRKSESRSDDAPDEAPAVPVTDRSAAAALRVAADPDSPPFLTHDAQGYAGFEYGVMLAIAGELGRQLEVVATDYADLEAALRNGAADVAIGQLPPAERPGLRSSAPYLEFTLCLVTRPGSDIESSAQLSGRRVASFDDAVAWRTIRALTGNEPVVIEDRVYAALLAAGEIDAMVNDCPLARYDAKKDPRRLRVVSSGLAPSSYVVVSRADDAVLARSIDQVLTDLGERGLLQQLEKRWLE